MASCPETVEIYAVTNQILWYNCKAKADTCETCIFGEAAQFNGAGSCSFALIDAVRYIFFGDVCFVCCIIDNYRTVFICIVYPFLKLRFGDGTTGWVVREAKVDKIRYFFREFRKEAVGCCTWHIDYVIKVATFFVVFSCTACHYVCIYIYWVYRVTHCNLVIQSEYFLDISGIALCTVRYKDFVCFNVTASVFVVILCNGRS